MCSLFYFRRIFQPQYEKVVKRFDFAVGTNIMVRAFRIQGISKRESSKRCLNVLVCNVRFTGQHGKIYFPFVSILISSLNVKDIVISFVCQSKITIKSTNYELSCSVSNMICIDAKQAFENSLSKQSWDHVSIAHEFCV